MNRRDFFHSTSVATGLAMLVPSILLSENSLAETGCNNEFRDYPGYNGKLKYRSLWTNNDSGGKASCTVLIADNGVSIPPHIHPEGEFLFVIEGAIRIVSTYPDGRKENVRLVKGDSIYFPAETIHHKEISEGVKVIIIEPKPIVKI